MPELSTPVPAIVTDALWRKSLSAIRSLGKAGFEITAMGNGWFTTGFWSRYTRHRISVTTAAENSAIFGNALLETCRKRPGAVILPMEDATLAWASDHREQLLATGAKFLIPPAEALRISQDKSQTLEVAERLGLPVPKTWRPETAEAFAALASQRLAGTFVVKPRSGSGSAGVAYGEPRTSDQWKEHWHRFGAMLVQERVPASGRGQGVSVLFDQNGECIAAFAHERIQQYPNSGGPSTDRQSIQAPELIEMSVSFLKHLGWRGIAMVEWKIHPEDGKPRLMEINPRFWGSLELAVRAGVNFPLLYAQAAQGKSPAPVLQYPAHVRCRWMIPGEILRFFTQPREQREAWSRFLKGLPEIAEEWDAKDLRGGLATLICTAALALNPRYWKYVRRG